MFARRRVLAWRRVCKGPDPAAKLSLVRGADVNAEDRIAEDVAWWLSAACTRRDDDQGIRIDVALRLLDGQDSPTVVTVWSRPGPTELIQSDLGWFAAVRHAAATRDVATPSLLVITRWGWVCLPAGTSRTWKRLRSSP